MIAALAFCAFAMAAYGRPSTGKRLGESVRKVIRGHNFTEEQVYLGSSDNGSCDKKKWSQMLAGDGPLDLNVLYDLMPIEPFIAFVSRLLSMKVEQHAQQMKREADEAAGKVA